MNSIYYLLHEPVTKLNQTLYMEPITETIANDECPICLLIIDTITNCMITPCGHKFHTSCFTRHALQNNSDCPCCRQCIIGANDIVVHAYADDTNNTDETDETDETYSYDSNDEYGYNAVVEEVGLRAFRFMYNQMDGLDIDPDDDFAENLYRNHEQTQAESATIINRMEVTHIVNRFVREFTHVFTYKDLVSALLASHIKKDPLYHKNQQVHNAIASRITLIVDDIQSQQMQLTTTTVDQPHGDIDI